LIEVATAKELRECRRRIARERADQAMYEQAARTAPDEGVKRWNQQRADAAAEAAGDYERWLKENG
jgi:hypothetical protein